MEIISLGSNCCVAYQKQQLNLKKETYPFDWLRVDSLNDINQCLDDNFYYFTKWIKINESTKFPIFRDDFEINDSKSIIMQNKYNMRFYHDFSDNSNEEEIREKYERRIKRFYQLIHSTTKIHFIRDEVRANKINNDIIDKFINNIIKINPKCQFTLTIILHQPKTILDDSILKTDHKSVSETTNVVLKINLVIDNKEFGDWTRPNVDWVDIFKIN
jgi:hypothetical protein